MELDQRVKAFVGLGRFLDQFRIDSEKQDSDPLNSMFYDDMETLIKSVRVQNPWFTESNVRTAIAAIADSLQEQTLINWLAIYQGQLQKGHQVRIVAVIMAGNIPMVGFNDFFCVLMSGNKFFGKLSGDDKLLLPFISKILIAIEPGFNDRIAFTEGFIKQMDAVIATGSNNSARYFDYYFGKYPHIIRKNRNSIAVLKGDETREELELLADDIFMYFGLGCRNVSKLYVPKGYSFNLFFDSIYKYQYLIEVNKYVNNYEYNRTVYLMKNDKGLLDNNFLLLKEDTTNSSPIGVLYYEYYDDPLLLKEKLDKEMETIQCVVSKSDLFSNAVYFGQTQCPTLFDYADGIDTMSFLIGLS